MPAIADKPKVAKKIKSVVDAVHEKTARINVRVSPRQRELIQEAAVVTGTSVSEFILVPAIERAANVLASEEVTRLNVDMAERFAAWMNEPVRAIPAMKRLANAEPFDDLSPDEGRAARPRHTQSD